MDKNNTTEMTKCSPYSVGNKHISGGPNSFFLHIFRIERNLPIS